jgi:hypothetical protein
VLRASAIEPDDVAEDLWHGMRADRFQILPHQDVQRYYELRATDTDRWLNGMGRLQQQIDRALLD